MSSLFTYFSSKTYMPKDYVSIDEWQNRIFLKAVLNEYTKSYPDTRKLYELFCNEKIGYHNGQINIFDIIMNYEKQIGSNNINEIIFNYKHYGKYLLDHYTTRNSNDKQKILYILNYFLLQLINQECYYKLNKIIQMISEFEGEINQFAIAIIISKTNIPYYIPTIIYNIINFRIFVMLF
jgi:hypothetical protein